MSHSLPRTFWLYAILTAVAYGYLALVPGEPGYGGPLPWAWIIVALALLLLIGRGSRLAWGLSLGLDLTTLFMLLFSTASQSSLKLAGLVLLQLGLIGLLLSPSLRRHVNRPSERLQR